MLKGFLEASWTAAVGATIVAAHAAVVAGGITALTADVVLNNGKKEPSITLAYFFAVNTAWNYADGYSLSYAISDAHRRSYAPIRL